MPRPAALVFLLPMLLIAAALPAAADARLDIREATLHNGLRVLMAPRYSVPVVSTMVWYRVGSSYEATGDEGLAHYLEHMLFKGTDRYKKGEIDLITMKNGGSNNAFTTEDYTAYYFNFASDRWQQALEIEANRMKRCLFVPREVESERKVVIEELKRAKDSPWGQLVDEVQGMAFMVHPYHHPIIGYQETLETVPRDHIFAFYNKHYNPVNATLVLVGDFEPAATMRRVEELFGPIPRGTRTAPIPLHEPPQAGEKRIIIRDSGELPRLLVSYHGAKFHSREAIVLDVAGHILSSGRSSRLYRKLVEDLKVASSVETSNDARRDPGLFHIQVELQPGASVAEAEGALDEEIGRICSADVSPAELQRARNIASAEFVFEQETASGFATKIGYFDTLSDRAFLESYLANVTSVTPAELRTTVAKFFVRSARTVGMSLPRSEESTAPSTSAAAASPAGRRSAFRTPPSTPAIPSGLPSGSPSAGKQSETLHQDPGSVRPASRRPSNAGATRPARGERGLETASKSKLDTSKVTLPNGLTLLLLENHSLPVVAVHAYVRADSRFETRGKEGLAEFVGRMLDEGTASRSAEQIAEAIESVGGRLATDSTGAKTLVLSRDLDLALDLTADCVISPLFAPERCDRERARILSDIRADQDEPSRVASNAFRELVYGRHPLHAPRKGYEQSVRQLGAKDLKDYHTAFYRPSNAVLAVVGDFDPNDIVARVTKFFGRWEPRPVQFPVLPLLERQKQPQQKILPMDKEQLNIVLGHLGVRRSSPDYYPLLVMDYILGTGPGFTDRISKKLRDEKGLAYTVYANISESSAEEPGTFSAYIGTSPANQKAAIDGLFHEIRLLRDKGCTAQELQNAKAYLTGSFVFNIETTSQLADFLIEIEKYQLGYDYIERFPKLIEAVTVADISRVARRYLDPDAMTVVVVGKAETAPSAPAPATRPSTR